MAERIEDRDMIIDAVFAGILPTSYITDNELDIIERNLFELVCAKNATTFYSWRTLQ